MADVAAIDAMGAGALLALAALLARVALLVSGPRPKVHRAGAISAAGALAGVRAVGLVGLVVLVVLVVVRAVAGPVVVPAAAPAVRRRDVPPAAVPRVVGGLAAAVSVAIDALGALGRVAARPPSTLPPAEAGGTSPR